MNTPNLAATLQNLESWIYLSKQLAEDSSSQAIHLDRLTGRKEAYEKLIQYCIDALFISRYFLKRGYLAKEFNVKRCGLL